MSTVMVTLAGYQAFLTNYVQIPTYALPSNSPSILMTLAISEATVNPLLKIANGSPNTRLGYTGDGLYEIAVYNLATDFLINFAQDQPGQDYFAKLRKSFTINDFVPGLISASADETTSESLLQQDYMKTLTLSDIQRMKTPYGRRYLEIAQSFGTLWGLS
jgi:hypothetical protein